MQKPKRQRKVKHQMNTEHYRVKKITYEETKPFILNLHYAKRMPSISYAYGLFENNELVGIISYGSPASPPLCRGIAGDKKQSTGYRAQQIGSKI
jgi:hypothetical protein